jgi:hypothetical protein
MDYHRTEEREEAEEPIWVISFGSKKKQVEIEEIGKRLLLKGFEHFFISFLALLPVFLFSNKLTFISPRKFV